MYGLRIEKAGENVNSDQIQNHINYKTWYVIPTFKLSLMGVRLGMWGSVSMDSRRTSSFSGFSSPYEKKIPKSAILRQIRIKVITSMLLLIAIWQFPEFPEENNYFQLRLVMAIYLKRIFRGRQFLLRGSTLQTSQEFGRGSDKSRLCSKGVRGIIWTFLKHLHFMKQT